MSRRTEELSGPETSDETRTVSQGPLLVWDFGTAYDLFISLVVLHKPDEFGLRASWASGVRSRLSTAERKVLFDAVEIFHAPLHWIYTLPEPKDSASALWSLRQLPPAERLPALSFYPGIDPDIEAMLRTVADKGVWDEGDLEALASIMKNGKKEHSLSRKVLEAYLGAWSRSADFGEKYLEALQNYYQSFFAEEEQRIAGAMRDAQRQSQKLAEEVPLIALFDHLSQGIQYEEMLTASEVVLAPSYWGTPFVFMGHAPGGFPLLTYGARPAEASLVPGEVVPDALLQALKALADPTRLRILRYLAHAPLTPAELARRLRLRAPTVTHHLKSLRRAGLVHLRLESSGENLYTARHEALQVFYQHLLDYIAGDEEEEVG